MRCPWGIAEDGVTADLDLLGLFYTITANRQDRRCLALPDKCPAHEWPEWRSLLDDLDVDSQEEHPSRPFRNLRAKSADLESVGFQRVAPGLFV